MYRIKKAAATIYGWDCPLLPSDYPGCDCDSNEAMLRLCLPLISGAKRNPKPTARCAPTARLPAALPYLRNSNWQRGSDRSCQLRFGIKQLLWLAPLGKQLSTATLLVRILRLASGPSPANSGSQCFYRHSHLSRLIEMKLAECGLFPNAR